MQKLILFFLLLSTSLSWSATNLLFLRWDHNPPEENVTNYTVFLGTVSRGVSDYPLKYDVGYSDEVFAIFTDGQRPPDIAIRTNLITGELATNDFSNVPEIRLPWSSDNGPYLSYWAVKAQNTVTNISPGSTNITATLTNIVPGFTNILTLSSDYSAELVITNVPSRPSQVEGLNIMTFNNGGIPIIGLGPITNRNFQVQTSDDLSDWNLVFGGSANPELIPNYLSWWIDSQVAKKQFWRLVQ